MFHDEVRRAIELIIKSHRDINDPSNTFSDIDCDHEKKFIVHNFILVIVKKKKILGNN